jgi:hypothetical protein
MLFIPDMEYGADGGGKMKELLSWLRCFFFHRDHDASWTDHTNKVGVTTVCKTCGRTMKM